MDSLIAAGARALAVGDPLAALNRVAFRDDAPALARRGIAMAQFRDLVRAKASCEVLRALSVRKRPWPRHFKIQVGFAVERPTSTGFGVRFTKAIPTCDALFGDEPLTYPAA